MASPLKYHRNQRCKQHPAAKGNRIGCERIEDDFPLGNGKVAGFWKKHKVQGGFYDKYQAFQQNIAGGKWQGAPFMDGKVQR